LLGALSDQNPNISPQICFLLLKKSDPHHPESDQIWDNPMIGPHCIREDSLMGKDTDVVIRIDGCSSQAIRRMIQKMKIGKTTTLFEVNSVLFGLYQEIPFSTLQRDLGYYFVKCGKRFDDLAALFVEANKKTDVNFSTHQLYLLKRGWLLAIMSADRSYDFNDYMKHHFYAKTGRIIESSYLLGVLELRRSSKPQPRADVISNMGRVINAIGGGARGRIAGILLERDASFGELVKLTGYSESQVSRALQELGETIIERKPEDGRYTLHRKELRPLYSYSRSR